MGRFDRDEANSEHISLGDASATEKLRASVERQVRAVVEEAMARAVAIEDRARVKASQTEQETQQKARDVLQETEQRANEVLRESQGRAGEVLGRAIQRTEGILQATDTLETELGKVIASFREEIELLRSELQAAKADLAAPPRPATAGTEPRTAVEAEPVAPEPPAAETPSPIPPRPEPPPAAPPPAAAQVSPAESNPAAPAGNDGSRDKIRQQLTRLRDAGKPREEAERYLERFKETGDYQAMLDEMYPPGEAAKRRRRGLLRRD